MPIEIINDSGINQLHGTYGKGERHEISMAPFPLSNGSKFRPAKCCFYTN